MALNFKADAFKGIEIYERSQMVPKGFVGEAEITQVLTKESNNPQKAACDYFIAEMKVTKTNMDADLPVGTQISFFASTEWGMPQFLKNVLGFLSAVSGITLGHPKWEEFQANASKMAEGSLSPAQPLKGMRLVVKAEEKEKTDKKTGEKSKKVYSRFYHLGA